MKIAALHSHLNGHEWMLVHRPRIWREIEGAIAGVDAQRLRTKVSREIRKKGRALYSPRAMNREFTRVFRALGWKESRTSYWVTDGYQLVRRTLALRPAEQKREIEEAGRPALASYSQTDFVKERAAIEIQFRKYSFIAYDLFVKHLAFFVGDLIDVGIEILPMKEMQKQMSSGVGYYEGALYDLARHGRGVPAVPLILIGLAP